MRKVDEPGRFLTVNTKMFKQVQCLFELELNNWPGWNCRCSRRCILVLKAPGTDFPSWYVSLRAGKPECTGDHEADICSSGWSRSKALRKSCLNCSLDTRADRSASSISRSVLLFVSSANTSVTGSSLLFHDLYRSIELSQENI